MNKVKLDREIEAIYCRHGEGVQVNILDISKIFAAGRTAHESGSDVETAIVAAIGVYRKN